MKTILSNLIYVLSILSAPIVSAQSTFILQNYYDSVVDAPVFDANGALLTGPDYVAELWGGAISNSLSPTVDFNTGQRVIVPFGTGAAAGYFYSTASMTVWTVPGNGYAWLEVRAWDTRLGATYEDVVQLGLGGYGESSLFYARGGDPLGAPPTIAGPLVGLESFSLLPVVPEPSTCVLLAMGGMVLWDKLRTQQRRHK